MNDIIERIKQLKKEKSALILAHNYQDIQIQDIADFRGDSLQLSILASEASAEIIVFCGVKFMAETAAMLNPSAKVLLPVLDAGCPMADMITGEQLRQFKAAHPGAIVICYVNSSAEVKAESDICCTSSNAVKIVKSIPVDQPILFVPDQNLGNWAARQSGREIITWDGYCPVHHWQFSLAQIDQLRLQYPSHTLLAHPECPPAIVDRADKVMSTSGMMDFCREHDQVIIATEHAMVKYLQHLYPQKSIIPLSPNAICQNMLKTRIHDLLHALEHEEHLITVPQDIASRAVKCLDRMLELSR